jgi:hypothetical protein
MVQQLRVLARGTSVGLINKSRRWFELRPLGTSSRGRSDSAVSRNDRTLFARHWLACGTRRLASCRPWYCCFDRPSRRLTRCRASPRESGGLGNTQPAAASPAPTAAAAVHEKERSTHRPGAALTDVTVLRAGCRPRRGCPKAQRSVLV